MKKSHLPDMTVITPVYMEGRGDGVGPSFFVASRGHHADVGGIAPGSMPPLSKTLEEVGTSKDRGDVKSGLGCLAATAAAAVSVVPSMM